jgi:TonB family protein
MLSLLLLAAAADPAALAPTNKWQVEYAANMCVLSRDYGTGADKVTLALRTLPMSENSEVVLLTQGNGPITDKGAGAIALLPAGQTATGSYQRYTVKGGDGRVATMFFAGDALAGLDKATAIEVRLGAESHRLAIPGITGALTALTTCQDDLLKGWGVDPAERKLEVTHVQGNPGRFFGPSEYPRAALSTGAQGLVTTLATVDAKGAVTACRVVVSSGTGTGHKLLDAATCDMVHRKVHFTPARDKDGNAVPSHYVLPVRWVMPGS